MFSSTACCGCLQCNSDVHYKQGGFTTRWQGLTFINTTKRGLWTVPYEDIFLDLDGSLTGTANGWTTPYYKWNEWAPACSRQSTTYDNGLVCDNSVVIRRLQINSVLPSTLDFVVGMLKTTALKRAYFISNATNATFLTTCYCRI